MSVKDVFYGNESNLRTVDKIVVLIEEIAVFQNRFEDSLGTHSDFKIVVNVLKNRVQELKDRVHD